MATARRNQFPGFIRSGYADAACDGRALIDSEPVCINVCDDAHEAEARAVLKDVARRSGAEAIDLAVSLFMVPTNEPWCRDHGPIFLTRECRSKIRHRTDSRVATWRSSIGITTPGETNIRHSISMKSFRPASPKILMLPVFYPGMILEGGAIDVNGAGALLTSESCLLNKNRNPNLSREQIEQRLARFSRRARYSLARRRDRRRRHRWPHRRSRAVCFRDEPLSPSLKKNATTKITSRFKKILARLQ